MPIIVLDASVIIAVVRDEPSRASILRTTEDARVAAAGSLPYEVGNALSSGLKRKLYTRGVALDAWQRYQAMTIELLDVPFDVAIEIFERYGIYAYDAYVLAVAKQKQLPLLTLDVPMRRIARDEGITLVEVQS